MEQLKNMKMAIMSCVQSQMGNLANVDAKELGEAIDMIKDLSEAIYYCTITEAMEQPKSNGESHYHYYTEPQMYYPERDMDKDKGRMYYDGNSGSGDRGSGSNGTRYYSQNMVRDPREGKSYRSRKMYMESKEMHKDKATAMQELEKYVQELTGDMVEMIEDASPEDRQYLEKRIMALADKIGKMNG